MTVKELIDELLKLDPTLPVTLHTGWEGAEHLPVHSIDVFNGEYVDGRSPDTSGDHVLISY